MDCGLALRIPAATPTSLCLHKWPAKVLATKEELRTVAAYSFSLVCPLGMAPDAKGTKRQFLSVSLALCPLGTVVPTTSTLPAPTLPKVSSP